MDPDLAAPAPFVPRDQREERRSRAKTTAENGVTASQRAADRTWADLSRWRPATAALPLSGFWWIRRLCRTSVKLTWKSVDPEPQTGERSSWKFKRGERRWCLQQKFKPEKIRGPLLGEND